MADSNPTLGDELSKRLRIIFIGPPGAGKSTQAAMLEERYGICHLATGNMLRAEIAKKTELGIEIQNIINAGCLVSDNIVVQMIKLELANNPTWENGFILDGFPRTVAQAIQLDQVLTERNEHMTYAVEFVVDENLLRERISARLVHPASGRVYHSCTKPPREHMKDDVTGEPLERRSDDNIETLDKRVLSYRESTAPLTEYYGKAGVLRQIDGNQEPEIVWKSLLYTLGENGHNC